MSPLWFVIENWRKAETCEDNVMVGLVLFAHNGLADSFLKVLQEIVGKQVQIETVSVNYDVSPDVVERQLDQAILKVDSGEGVVILTDLFGGSPANFSLARLSYGKVEVVSGLNLAMLLKAVDLRTQQLANPTVMARAISRSGRDNIVLASDCLVKETVTQVVTKA
jgi:PTS system mannose-specific IIA component